MPPHRKPSFEDSLSAGCLLCGSTSLPLNSAIADFQEAAEAAVSAQARASD
ncbi:hypothetical protein GCM10010178_91900 [Lentzea flava]|uniref:Uncharacterized protein n=1 Tax=Lentzea flava TaxID=103732 RepID=A0ABQ2VHV4_9PSEU|nr:hypothetical protein GCM10010178_91900 [Lentzea flava]